jgi:TolB protein
MKPAAFFFTACLLGITAACGTSNAIPTAKPIAVPSLTPSITAPPYSHAAPSTSKPTPSITPTSLPGPPQLIQPVDGAVLPQPVYPDGWVFSWTARTGPCHATITIEGPGGLHLGDEYIDWYTAGYRYTYMATEYFSGDVLDPWYWYVEVICPSGSNRSEQREFWVEASPIPSPLPPSLPDQELVYCSTKDMNSDLYLISPVDPKPERLTTNPESDCFPEWSPNGDYIAFASEIHNKYEIHILDLWTGETTQIINFPGVILDVAWSPDSSRIAFAYQAPGRKQELWTIGSDGSNLNRVTTASTTPRYGLTWDPAWSPDGSLIAYMTDIDETEGWNIYIVSPDGANPRLLAGSTGLDAHPVWSPDSKYVLFISDRDGARDRNEELYVISIQTMEVKRVTDDPRHDGYATWSPNGRMVASIRWTYLDEVPDSRTDIIVSNLEQSIETNITENYSDLGIILQSPSWSADGKWLAFTCYFESNDYDYEICLISTDGSHLIQITDNTWEDGCPAFRPQ